MVLVQLWCFDSPRAVVLVLLLCLDIARAVVLVLLCPCTYSARGGNTWLVIFGFLYLFGGVSLWAFLLCACGLRGTPFWEDGVVCFRLPCE